MNQGERHDRLKKIAGELPLRPYGFTDESKFWSWQGMVATLLSFNPQLQSEF